jgi:hypothetical protein
MKTRTCRVSNIYVHLLARESDISDVNKGTEGADEGKRRWQDMHEFSREDAHITYRLYKADWSPGYVKSRLPALPPSPL